MEEHDPLNTAIIISGSGKDKKSKKIKSNKGSEGAKEKTKVSAGDPGRNEDAESLRSRSEAIVVAVLSEGEILGFAGGTDPFTQIYLDDVPIRNNDGSYNFQVDGIFTGSPANTTGKSSVQGSWGALGDINRVSSPSEAYSFGIDYRAGTQDQSAMPLFGDVKTEQSVNAQLKVLTGPVTKTTVNASFNRIRIRVGVGALFAVNSKNGDVKGTSVTFNIQIRPQGGSLFVNEDKTINGKSRGPVDFEYEYALQGSAPWVVKLTRNTPDADTTNIQNDLFFKSIVGIIDRSFRYPNTALLGLKFGSESFNSIPSISAKLLGIKVKIPTNYNPYTRQYSGIWNGTFKVDWTDNPAWIFYDLLTNARYGTGSFISESNVDRYSLYPIAQYCDESVPNGSGGVEPRFTFNAYITSRGEAYEVLNSLAAAFRGMLYFSEGSIVAIQDKPKSITKIFSPANVIQEVDENGLVTSPPFTYEGTARRARKTVALVSWNDASDNFKNKIEYVEDRDGLERYGYHETEIRAFGSISQGQAQRVGRWTLLTDQLETETVTFKVSTEGFFVLPGEIVGIADPGKGGKRYGGRIESGSTSSSVAIDSPFTIANGASYTVSVALPTGSVETRVVTNGAGVTSTLTVSPALSQAPDPASAWVLQENGEGTRAFRVVSVNEENGSVTVFAILYNETKFSSTDNNTILSAKRSSSVADIVVPRVAGTSIILGAPG
jgi:predicted phage tail protein